MKSKSLTLMHPFLRLFLLLLLTSPAFSQNFKTEQLKFNRVKGAFDHTWPDLKKQIIEKGLDPNSYQVFFRVFKKEQKFEVYLSSLKAEKFILFKTYEIAASSGEIGPKRTEGDLQVPEGYYQVNVFNPQSNFHLSLGINYPNGADKIKGKKPYGGDIYIHGAEVTIGCIPLTDSKIEEVYALAVQAKSNGQKKIYAHFYPFDFNKNPLSKYLSNSNINLWKSLEKGQKKFDLSHKIPFVKINKAGDYILN